MSSRTEAERCFAQANTAIEGSLVEDALRYADLRVSMTDSLDLRRELREQRRAYQVSQKLMSGLDKGGMVVGVLGRVDQIVASAGSLLGIAVQPAPDEHAGEAMNVQVSSVHLSDIHFGHPTIPQYTDRVLSKLQQSLCSLDPSPDIVLVSGDLTWKPDHFGDVRVWLMETGSMLGLSSDRILCVPGNHDLSWDVRKGQGAYRSAFRDALESDLTTFKFYTSHDEGYPELREKVDLRWQAHKDFESSMGYAQRFYGPHYSSDIVCEDRLVRVIGLNSAYTSAFWMNKVDGEDKANDMQRLVLCDKCVRDAVSQETSDTPDLVVGLVHHPTDWLQSYEEGTCVADINKGCDLLLHGHVHGTANVHCILPGAEVVVMATRAILQTGGDYNSGFAHICIDLESKLGVSHLYRYSPLSGGGWVPDEMSYPGVGSHFRFTMPD